MHKNKVSRRGFGRRAAGFALTAAAPAGTVARHLKPAPFQAPEDEENDLTAAQRDEVDARFHETIRRYDNRLSDKQRERIRRVLVQNQRMLAPIRDFAIANGDAPATVLKPLMKESPGPR